MKISIINGFNYQSYPNFKGVWSSKSIGCSHYQSVSKDNFCQDYLEHTYYPYLSESDSYIKEQLINKKKENPGDTAVLGHRLAYDEDTEDIYYKIDQLSVNELERLIKESSPEKAKKIINLVSNIYGLELNKIKETVHNWGEKLETKDETRIKTYKTLLNNLNSVIFDSEIAKKAYFDTLRKLAEVDSDDVRKGIDLAVKKYTALKIGKLKKDERYEYINLLQAMEDNKIDYRAICEAMDKIVKSFPSSSSV